MQTNPDTAAVLSGDVVGSTRAGKAPLERLPELLEAAAEAGARFAPDAGVSAIDIFRGDSWQILVRDAKAALRVGLLMRSFLLGGEARNEPSWDTRIGIGIGSVDRIHARNISKSQGEAFLASGRAIDAIAKDRARLALRWRLQPADLRLPPLDASLVLLDAVVQNWTSKQAWAVHGALRGLSQQKIAGEFQPPVKQPTIVRHLEKARWEAVAKGLQLWTSLFPTDEVVPSEIPK